MNGNNTVVKTLASAGAAAIIGVLFWYFMQHHFTLQRETNEVLRDDIKTREELRGVIYELKNAIISPSGQKIIRDAFLARVSNPKPVDKQFEVIFDPDFKPNYPTTTAR